MVEVQGKTRYFGGSMRVYNNITRIHQHIKVEETMSEVMKHKKDLSSTKMLEDEAITI